MSETLMALMKKGSSGGGGKINDVFWVTVGGAGACIGGVYIPVEDIENFTSLTATKINGRGTFTKANFRYVDSSMAFLTDSYDFTLDSAFTIPTIPQGAEYVRIIFVISTTNNYADLFELQFT